MISNRNPDNLANKAVVHRACLFSFYDEQGIVDDYVLFLLTELRNFVENIVFISNGPLTEEATNALKGIASQTIVRPNEGFDVLAYKEGLNTLDFNRDGLYDEVLMVNHTCYGPVFPFHELFDAMEARTCDFWGITAHMEMTPNPFTGSGRLPYHLNSNFIVVRRNMLQSEAFRKYWNQLEGHTTYEEAILSHEAVFTEYFVKLGYICECYLDCRKYGTHYPAMLDVDETLLDRNPLLKRRIFFHDPRLLEHYAADLPRALSALEKTSNYDRSLIWRNITRTAELRTLNTNAALTSVFPDIRIKQDDSGSSYGNIAVCAHVYYTDMLEELLALADTIPCSYDFIATTETIEKKAIIEQTVVGRKNVGKVIVRVVERNRGRDMSALFITCRDLFLDDHYDLVCRLHTKKSPQVAAGQANVFKRHMFENLLNSPGFTTNVLDMFRDQPWIGVAVPPLIHMSYPTMGHVWFGNDVKAKELAKLLNLKVKFDPDTPVGAFGTMFWFRPKALRKLFEHPWQWNDFNAEPNHVDGGLAHVLERLICYVAQDARYTTQQILSSHLASWNFAMLEYKVQKLSAALPVSDFNYECHFLAEWKAAGYRTIQHRAGQPSSKEAPGVGTGELSFGSAWDNFYLAAKRSMTFRFPKATKLLRHAARVNQKARDAHPKGPWVPVQSRELRVAEPKAQGALDLVNDLPAEPVTYFGKAERISATGWVTSSTNSAPDGLKVILKGANSYCLETTTGIARPDVTESCRMDATCKPGFRFETTLAGVETGTYRVILMISVGRARELCETRHQIVVLD